MNLRDRERWISSRFDHNDGSYAKAVLAIHGFDTLSQLADKWRSDWDEHLTEVQANLPPNKLLVLDIERQPLSVIDEFLGLEPSMDVSPVPANFTRSQLSRWLSGWLSRYTPKQQSSFFQKKLIVRFTMLLGNAAEVLV